MPRQPQSVGREDGRIVGTLHLVFVPGLSRSGTKRAIIEAVRVASDLRGENVGTALIKHAIEIARAKTAARWCR